MRQRFLTTSTIFAMDVWVYLQGFERVKMRFPFLGVIFVIKNFRSPICQTTMHTQQKKKVSFCNNVNLLKILCDVINSIFPLSRYISRCLVHSSYVATATIRIFPSTQKKEHKTRCKMQKKLSSINLHKTVHALNISHRNVVKKSFLPYQ